VTFSRETSKKGGAAESNGIVKDLCEMGQVDVGELLAM
jgi:hypothetical protein